MDSSDIHSEETLIEEELALRWTLFALLADGFDRLVRSEALDSALASLRIAAVGPRRADGRWRRLRPPRR